MNELIAKKYVQGLYKALDAKSLEAAAEALEALSEALTKDNVAMILNAPDVTKEQKTDILTSAIKDAKSKELENLIKLLVENKRIELISEIAVVLRKLIANEQRKFSGLVYSDSDIDSKVLEELGNGLGKKFNSTITLSYVKSDFDGIRVDVEDLGVEISFSKSRINKQIVEHILKAI